MFFDDSDELSVLDLKGHVEPLQTSAFVKQPDVCLVFLYEAHTRGTDLRLPHDYRAAVTLGPGVTKDRLVQGMSAKSVMLIAADLTSMHENEEARQRTISCLLRSGRDSD